MSKLGAGLSAIALAVAVVAVVACRDRDSEKESSAGAGAGAAAGHGDAHGGDAPVVEADRFGPLSRHRRIDRRALARMVPGARVTRERAGAGFEVRRGGQVLFRVVPADDGTISSVRITSRTIPTHLGARVGDRFEDVRRGAGPLECNGGLEAQARDVLCTPRRAHNVAFVFALGDDSHAGDDLPAEKLGAILGGHRVSEILWQPPAAR